MLLYGKDKKHHYNVFHSQEKSFVEVRKYILHKNIDIMMGNKISHRGNESKIKYDKIR